MRRNQQKPGLHFFEEAEDKGKAIRPSVTQAVLLSV